MIQVRLLFFVNMRRLSVYIGCFFGTLLFFNLFFEIYGFACCGFGSLSDTNVGWLHSCLDGTMSPCRCNITWAEALFWTTWICVCYLGNYLSRMFCVWCLAVFASTAFSSWIEEITSIDNVCISLSYCVDIGCAVFTCTLDDVSNALDRCCDDTCV